MHSARIILFAMAYCLSIICHTSAYVTPGTCIAFIRSLSAHIPMLVGLQSKSYSAHAYSYLEIGINGFKSVTLNGTKQQQINDPYETTPLAAKIVITTALSISLGWLLDFYPQRKIYRKHNCYID